MSDKLILLFFKLAQKYDNIILIILYFKIDYILQIAQYLVTYMCR